MRHERTGRLSPCLSAFLAERDLPPVVFGPVLERAFGLFDFILHTLLTALSPPSLTYSRSVEADHPRRAAQPDADSDSAFPDARRFRAKWRCGAPRPARSSDQCARCPRA